MNPQLAVVLAPGSNKDGGILPRSLAVIFNSVGDRLYQAMDLKPSLSNEVIWLDSRQVRQEETKKQTMLQGGLLEVSMWLLGGLLIGKGWCPTTYMLMFFVSFQEELLTPLKRSHSAESQLQATTSGSFDSGVAGLSSSSQLTNHSDVSQTEGMSGSLLSATCCLLLEDGGRKGDGYLGAVLWVREQRCCSLTIFPLKDKDVGAEELCTYVLPT